MATASLWRRTDRLKEEGIGKETEWRRKCQGWEPKSGRQRSHSCLRRHVLPQNPELHKDPSEGAQSLAVGEAQVGTRLALSLPRCVKGNPHITSAHTERRKNTLVHTHHKSTGAHEHKRAHTVLQTNRNLHSNKQIYTYICTQYTKTDTHTYTCTDSYT